MYVLIVMVDVPLANVTPQNKANGSGSGGDEDDEE